MALWEEMAKVSTAYVLGGSRYDMHDTDCSGMVCATLCKFAGIDPFDAGWWTGGMWVSDKFETVYHGNRDNLPLDRMRPDDLVFTSTQAEYFDSVNGSHVGLYVGDGEYVSHFCDGGPLITALDGVYDGNERYFGVRRLRGMSNDVLGNTEYQEPYPTGADIGTRIVWIDLRVKDIAEIVINPNAIGAVVMSYKNSQINGDKDVYQLITDIHRDMNSLHSRLDAIESKLDGLV